MAPVVSLQPDEEPTVSVKIKGHEYPFMVKTGATYSCIGKGWH